MKINEIIKILTYDQRVKELTVYNGLIEDMDPIAREKKFLITAKAEEEAVIILKEVEKLYEATKKENLRED